MGRGNGRHMKQPPDMGATALDRAQARRLTLFPLACLAGRAVPAQSHQHEALGLTFDPKQPQRHLGCFSAHDWVAFAPLKHTTEQLSPPSLFLCVVKLLTGCLPSCATR